MGCGREWGFKLRGEETKDITRQVPRAATFARPSQPRARPQGLLGLHGLGIIDADVVHTMVKELGLAVVDLLAELKGRQARLLGSVSPQKNINNTIAATR